MRLSRLADSGEIKVQQLADELVGMLCGDAVSGQHEITYSPVGWTPRPSGSVRTDEASILRVNQDLPLA